MYDGFISYSHAADGLLAPRLQSALQRFAKPWWRRRAVRIFRDESSLSANPHLWSSITEALDTSGWFVLLLSPDAARSEWVNQEISYWVENRDPKKILPVVTDGTFGWADDDVAGDAVPEALRGVFSEEPRWVDIRWAEDEDQLDLQDPRFADAVADVASTIRGIPKDDLASEEVRQHRRTVRTAWAAGGLVTVLAIVAVGFGIRASSEAERADQNAVQAQANAEEAEQQRSLALQNEESAIDEAERANQAATEAQAAERVARSETLEASALAVMDEDPELAVLLAVEAVRGADGLQGHGALHQALQRHRTLDTFEWDEAADEWKVAAISPGGGEIAISSQGELRLVDRISGNILWTVQLSETENAVANPVQPIYFSAGGDEVIVPVSSNPAPAELFRVAVDDGSIIRTIAIDCFFRLADAGSRFIDVAEPVLVATGPSPDGGCRFPNDWSLDIGLLDLESGEIQPVTRSEEYFNSGDPSYSHSGDVVAVRGPGRTTQVIDIGTGAVVQEFDSDLISMLSPDGTEILLGGRPPFPLERRSVETGELLMAYQGEFSYAWFAGDGSQIVGTSFTGATKVFDAATGVELVSLRGHQTRPANASWSADGSLLVTSAFEEQPRLWNVRRSARGDTESIDVGMSEEGWHQFPAQLQVTDDFILVPFWEEDFSVARYSLLDRSTGEILRTGNATYATVSADGSMLAELPVSLAGDDGPESEGRVFRTDPLRIVDPVSGELIRKLESCGFYWLNLERRYVPFDGCSIEDIDDLADLEFSRDGTTLAGWNFDHGDSIWDVATGEKLRSGDHLEGFDDWSPVAVSHDGSTVFTWSYGDATVELISVDLETGEEMSVELQQPAYEMVLSSDGDSLYLADRFADLVVVDTSDLSVIDRFSRGQGGSLRAVDINSDATLAATAGFDGFVRVWDLTDGLPVVEFEVEGAADIGGLFNTEFLDDSTLLVTGGATEVLVFSLDRDELIDIASSRVTRGFTDLECTTYNIDPCPTLEELRGG